MRIARQRRQAGDTIVEVLICIGIISVVLTGAFVVARRSSTSIQDSNEHSQAELALQSQIETFKDYMDAGTAPAPAPGIDYCMSGRSLVAYAVSVCNTVYGGGATYTLKLKRVAPSDDRYAFSVSWPSVSGGTAHETYVYRVYPGS